MGMKGLKDVERRGIHIVPGDTGRDNDKPEAITETGLPLPIKKGGGRVKPAADGGVLFNETTRSSLRCPGSLSDSGVHAPPLA
jgi:hypothetical protein